MERQSRPRSWMKFRSFDFEDRDANVLLSLLMVGDSSYRRALASAHSSMAVLTGQQVFLLSPLSPQVVGSVMQQVSPSPAHSSTMAGSPPQQASPLSIQLLGLAMSCQLLFLTAHSPLKGGGFVRPVSFSAIRPTIAGCGLVPRRAFIFH